MTPDSFAGLFATFEWLRRSGHPDQASRVRAVLLKQAPSVSSLSGALRHMKAHASLKDVAAAMQVCLFLGVRGGVADGG